MLQKNKNAAIAIIVSFLVTSPASRASQDLDGDGIDDAADNCTLVLNQDQLDADADGYGNICDADLNNSGLVTANDFNLLRGCLNQTASSTSTCAAADLNGSGLVTSADFNTLRKALNTAPGPSGLHQIGTAPFLPYPSSDASVVYRHSLTGNPSGAGLTATIYGAESGPEHSPILGMRGAAAGGADPSGYIVSGFDQATLAALDAGGQISVEVSTRYLTQTADNAGGSAGDSLAAETTPVHFANAMAPGNGQIFIMRRSPGAPGTARVTTDGITLQNGSERSFLGWTDTEAAGSAGFFNSFGKPASGFTRVNVGWYSDATLGDIIVMAVDGVTLQWAPRDDTVNPFTHLALGGAVNWFSGQIISPMQTMTAPDHWMRNLQISTQPPAMPTIATGPLRRVAILSDSIIPASDWYQTFWRDINIDVRIVRAMEQRGVRPELLYRMQAGGHTMTDGIGAPSFKAGNPATQVVSSGNPGVEARSLVKAVSPTTIVINGGSNDVGYAGSSAANFGAAMRDLVEYFCGLDGTSHGGSDYSANPPAVMPSYIFFTNIPDRGFNWDDWSTTTGFVDGTTTVTGVTVPNDFAVGDRIGAYTDSNVHIPVDTVVVGGGGTSTLELSRPAIGAGQVRLFELGEHSSTIARQKAATFRAEIALMPAWFEATFPGSSVELRVIDTFTATGGTGFIPGKIREDGVHPDYYATFHGNEAIAASLLTAH